MIKDKKEQPDQMETWLGLLDDKERAEVLKVQIAEREKTERIRIERASEIQQRLHQTEGYHFVRGLWAFAAVCAIAASTCVGYKTVEAVQSIKTPAGNAPTVSTPTNSVAK